MTARTLLASCTLLAFALPAHAQITLDNADRSVLLESVYFQNGGGTEPLGEVFEQASTSGPGLFDENFSGDAASFPSNPRIGGSVSQRSTITATGAEILIDATSFSSALAITSGQNDRGETRADSLFTIGFTLGSAGTFSMGGFIEGQSARFSGLVSSPQASFTAVLTGPEGELSSTDLGFFDLPFVEAKDRREGQTPFEVPAIPLAPGSYTFEINLENFEDFGFGNLSGSGYRGELGYSLNAIITPAPSALALLTIAPLVSRRRR